MPDYTVTVEETAGNTVTAQDIVNSITISETDSNSVTVVASTFVNDAGSSSNLFIPAGHRLTLLAQRAIFILILLPAIFGDRKGSLRGAAIRCL